jgi:acyl-CoA dehydrogenase
MINPTETRERLCDCIYKAREPGNPLGLLQEALEAADRVRLLERRVFDASRDGQIKSDDTPGQIDEAERLGILSADEAEKIRAFDARTLELLAVDDFAPEDLPRRSSPPARRNSAQRKTRKKKTAPPVSASAADSESTPG